MTQKTPLRRLTADERTALEATGRRGRPPARQIDRARSSLRVDDAETAEALAVGLAL